jgi:hypothetical protein
METEPRASPALGGKKTKMKRNTVCLLLMAAALSLLSGCAQYLAPVKPPQGLFFTKVSAPLSTDFKSTPVCEKSGQASTFYVHDIIFTGLDFAWSDAGLKDAADNGGIKAVEYADYQYMLVMGVFGKFTVTAYGR